MKIDEPKTPYEYASGTEDDDDANLAEEHEKPKTVQEIRFSNFTTRANLKNLKTQNINERIGFSVCVRWENLKET